MALLSGGLLFGQQAHKQPVHTQMVSQLLRLNEERHVIAMKPTAGVLTQRVIAQSTRDNVAGTLTDSVRLRYSGMRASTYDYNSMIYAYNYPYSTTPMFNYAGVFTAPQVKYDTYVHWTINPFTMPAYGLYESYYATYDTNSNLKTFKKLYVDSTLNDNMSYMNTFTTANKISKGYTFNLNAGVADSAFIQYFAYDTAKRLVKDSVYELHLGVWRKAAKTTYTYDAAGNLTIVDNYTNVTDTSFLLPLTQTLKYTNTYDASNRLITVLTTMTNGTTMGDYVKDTFGYSGTLTYHNSWKQHQMDPIHGTWWPQYYMNKHITAGKPDTITHNGWDSIANRWVPSSMDIAGYNTDNNPDTVYKYQYNWTAFSATPDYTTVYYYDTFTYVAPVSATNTLPETASISIYPNPAGNVVTLAMPAAFDNEQISVTILNINGQVISRQVLRSQQNNVLPTDHLQTGMYLITVQDRNGRSLHQQQLLKQ
jgi:hypothetical protein